MLVALHLDNGFRQQGIRRPECRDNPRNLHDIMTHLAAYWLMQFRRKRVRRRHLKRADMSQGRHQPIKLPCASHRWLFVAWVVAVQSGCNDNLPVSHSPIPPNISISLSDTLVVLNQGIQFTILASANISLRTVGWSVSGAVVRNASIEFVSVTSTYSQDVSITSGLAPGSVTIVATATDGSGNAAVPDTVTAAIVDPG